MKTFRKQPKDHLDYDLLLGNWLAEGDEIVSVDVVAPEGIEVTQIGVEPDRIKLWIKGGQQAKATSLTR